MPALPLNSENLPYPDPLHPIIVHFVIAMVFFSFFCDVVGYFTHKHQFFEVSVWNLLVASVTVFLAVIFGQFEAGLAQPYKAAQSTLTYHTLLGWLLSALIVLLTTWRFAIRTRSPLKVSPVYLGVATFAICLVSLQVYLGSRLFWVYGLHVEPIVEAMKKGGLQ